MPGSSFNWTYYFICSACFLFQVPVRAQWVSYSEPTGRMGAEKEWMAGRAGNNYWLLKWAPSSGKKKMADVLDNWEQHVFEIYDSRLRYLKKINTRTLPYQTKKIYALGGSSYMDLLLFIDMDTVTDIHRTRYTPEGSMVSDTVIARFPFKEPPDRFLVCRSEDRRKVLLLGFESVEESSPNVHAILLEENGRIRSQHLYRHPSLTQPMIQDEVMELPVEHFSNAPVQLLNAGDWLMIVSSRTGNQYEWFHFPDKDTAFVVRSIRKPAKTTLEDLVLTVNNNRKIASAGILSRFSYRSLKNVQVARYDLQQKAILLDTSYRFNALLSDKVNTKNLIKEHLTAVPGSGFILLREYGRSIDHLYDGMTLPAYNGSELITSNGLHTYETPLTTSKEHSYQRIAGLGGMRTEFERGDLSIFFFPSLPGDSSWSGLIHKPQITEFNSPYLSYLLIPVKGSLHILNNDFYSPWKQYGSSTVLTEQGKWIEGMGTVFWRYQNVLIFQSAVRISSNEISVPYRWNERTGFSIIRF